MNRITEIAREYLDGRINAISFRSKMVAALSRIIDETQTSELAERIVRGGNGKVGGRTEMGS